MKFSDEEFWNGIILYGLNAATESCLIVGGTKAKDFVGSSQDTFN